MGGTLIRLTDQGHNVHVAYQTSGNISVFDDEVYRYLDFTREVVEQQYDDWITVDELEDTQFFSIDEECHHFVQYKSVDNVENQEDFTNNSLEVYVDGSQ